MSFLRTIGESETGNSAFPPSPEETSINAAGILTTKDSIFIEVPHILGNKEKWPNLGVLAHACGSPTGEGGGGHYVREKPGLHGSTRHGGT